MANVFKGDQFRAAHREKRESEVHVYENWKRLERVRRGALIIQRRVLNFLCTILQDNNYTAFLRNLKA